MGYTRQIPVDRKLPICYTIIIVNKKEPKMKLNFTQYMLDFYGKDGIYPFGFTTEQINLATQLYKCRMEEQFGQDEFEGDSVDRERVRDIILDNCYPELV